MELNSKRPLFMTLSSANSWQNLQGVNVLDEMRDILIRLPESPDFIVERLAYTGNLNGRPTFVIRAKITRVELLISSDFVWLATAAMSCSLKLARRLMWEIRLSI